MPADRVRVGVVDQGRQEKLQPYLDALLAAGADVTVLRWQDPERDPAADATAFEAVVLCGGGDVDARNWGDANHPSVELVPERRDAYEMALARTAIGEGVPLLGICRGAQVMNVALGGSLEQHVPDLAGRGAHGGGALHVVILDQASLLGRVALCRREAAVVNSWHHQAVGRVAPGLRVTARCEDGGVEAVEGPGSFCLGVQWHPEREGCDEPYGRGLFAALVEAGRNRRKDSVLRSSKG